MRTRLLPLGGLLCLFVSCYDQPLIPRDKPISCQSSDMGECPEGFQCVPGPQGGGICALEQCTMNTDCPLGLVCSRLGCVPPGAADDGGTGDGGTDQALLGDGAGGLLPDAGTGTEGDRGGSIPPVLGDPPGVDGGTITNPTLDAQGGS